MGKESSLAKSLIASANGCGNPIKLTLFGPLRIWIYPRIFRSRRVKKAMAIRIIK